MKTKNTDVVAEYLHEVDVRLARLPVLQRRELLADLAAHIETERAERNLRTEGELIEVLERLGSPDVVAAAAYEEAGPIPVAPPPMPPPPTPTPSPQRRVVWPFVAAVGISLGLLVVLLLCAGTFFFARSSGPEPAPMIENATPVGPEPTATVSQAVGAPTAPTAGPTDLPTPLRSR